eukprot:5510654-Pyramimonas_sp.AAC.1
MSSVFLICETLSQPNRQFFLWGLTCMRRDVAHAPDKVLTTGQKSEAAEFARWVRRSRQPRSTLAGRAARTRSPSRSDVSESIMMPLAE